MTVLRFQQLPGIESGRQAAQPLRRSCLVVLVSPGFDDGLGVGQSREPVLVEHPRRGTVR